jgi:hypothetical protein
VQSESDLFEIVFALSSAGGFAGLLHGGEQQSHKDCNDGDHNEQFDEGERARF